MTSSSSLESKCSENSVPMADSHITSLSSQSVFRGGDTVIRSNNNSSSDCSSTNNMERLHGEEELPRSDAPIEANAPKNNGGKCLLLFNTCYYVDEFGRGIHRFVVVQDRWKRNPILMQHQRMLHPKKKDTRIPSKQDGTKNARVGPVKATRNANKRQKKNQKILCLKYGDHMVAGSFGCILVTCFVCVVCRKKRKVTQPKTGPPMDSSTNPDQTSGFNERHIHNGTGTFFMSFSFFGMHVHCLWCRHCSSVM